MITLAWVLFWLGFYAPEYQVDFEVRVASLPANHAAESYYDNNKYVLIDLPKIVSLSGPGPWDKVVLAACAIAHESVHMHRRDSIELYAYQESVRCISTFQEKVARTPWLDYAERYYRSLLVQEQANIGSASNE